MNYLLRGSRRAHVGKLDMEAVGLLCSPNAHTRSIVFLERRCSSKRAVGDQSASISKTDTSELGVVTLSLKESKQVRDRLASSRWSEALPTCLGREVRASLEGALECIRVGPGETT